MHEDIPRICHNMYLEANHSCNRCHTLTLEILMTDLQAGLKLPQLWKSCYRRQKMRVLQDTESKADKVCTFNAFEAGD